MIPTANWYCAKCSRFVDNLSTTCDSCGRIRGSARSAVQEEPNLYWVRVARGRTAPQPPRPLPERTAPPPKESSLPKPEPQARPRSEASRQAPPDSPVNGDGRMPFSSHSSSSRPSGGRIPWR